jgi:hypothetical protein
MDENSLNNYNDALEEYYKLKQEYDRNYKRKLRTIKKKDISLKEKRELLRKIKLPCIHCKKRVGTIFTNEGGVLKALCGGTPACSLNIEIKKADTRFLPAVIANVQRIIQKIKREIIETKLDFLFGLETEKDTVGLFESLKEKFNKASGLLVNLEGVILELYASKERKESVEEAVLQLYVENERFANAIAQYKETQTPSFLTDAIEIYINNILSLQERIQYNKYANIYVDRENKDGVIILDKEPPAAYVLKTPTITIIQQEHEWEPGIIKHNLK